METYSVLDRGFKRKMTPEEESQFYLFKIETEIAGRRVRHGRYALYALAGIFTILGLGALQDLFQAKNTSIDDLSIQFLTGLTIGLITLGVIFAGLAWLSLKYPVPAFLAATGIFLTFALVQSGTSIVSIVFDIAWKGVLVYYLVRAAFGARQLIRIYREAAALGIAPEELF